MTTACRRSLVPPSLYGSVYAPYGDFDTDYPQSYRAGASRKDYFLLENRWVPETLDETPFDEVRLQTDQETKVILYLAGQLRGTATWVNSGLYDFFLPAGGLLIWHVNEDRIAEGLDDNTINWYGDGLRLVEADGIQDVGTVDAYVRGWYGSDLDPFHERYGFQNLYSDGYPSSRCYDRSWTGLNIWDVRNDVSGMGGVMRFGASLDPILPNFPWEIAAVDSLEARRERRVGWTAPCGADLLDARAGR